MDLESYPRWYEYSRARDRMLEMTDTDEAPWYIVRSNDKKRARLNCIAHLLSLFFRTRRYNAPGQNCPSAPTSTATTTRAR